jgi:hypothetical protein
LIIKIEDVFTEDELDTLYEMFFIRTGSTDLDEVMSLYKKAAVIRLSNRLLGLVLDRRIGISLRDGEITFGGTRLDG